MVHDDVTGKGAKTFQQSSAATSKPPPNMAEDAAASRLRQSPA
jgi:hypothetical protein